MSNNESLEGLYGQTELDPLTSTLELIGRLGISLSEPDNAELTIYLGGPIGYMAHFNRVYEQELDQNKLPRKPRFEERIRSVLESSPNSVALLMIDFDNFKVFNDTIGHHRTDQVMFDVAELIKRSIREGQGDYACRFGGDEFVIGLSRLQADVSKDDGVGIFIKIFTRFDEGLAQIEAELQEDYPGLELKYSPGIAFSADHDGDYDRTLEAADRAMYRAKGKQIV